MWSRVRTQLLNELEDVDSSKKSILDQLNHDTRPITSSEANMLILKLDEFDDDIPTAVLRKFKKELLNESANISIRVSGWELSLSDENGDLDEVTEMRNRLREAKWVVGSQKEEELKTLNSIFRRWQKRNGSFSVSVTTTDPKKGKKLMKMFDEKHKKHAEEFARNFDLSYPARVSRVLEEMRNFNDAFSLSDARAFVSDFGSAKKSSAKKSTAKKSSAKRSSAKKSTAKKSTAKKSTAKKSTAKKSSAKKSTAKKSTAKKSTAKKSTEKKSSAKKSTEKKSSAKKSSAKKTSAKKTATKKTQKKT